MLAIRALDEIQGPSAAASVAPGSRRCLTRGPLICDPDPPYLSLTLATDFTSALRTLTHIYGRSRTSTRNLREAHALKGAGEKAEGEGIQRVREGTETEVLGGARILFLSLIFSANLAGENFLPNA